MIDVPDSLADSALCLGTLNSNYQCANLTDNDIYHGLNASIWPDSRKTTVFDLVQPRESVCIVVSDYTRKTATDIVLRVLLYNLLNKGCSIGDMFILIASGIHRPPTSKEIKSILGEDIAKQFTGRIFIHDPDDNKNLVYVGTTKRGHSVRVNKQAVTAKRLILIGSASYHYHAGFGGGRKSLVPGLAARDTIAHNHSLTLDPNYNRINPMATIGVLKENPVSEEMLESAYMCHPDIIINTVLTAEGKLAGIFSGELNAAHLAACKLVKKISGIEVKRSSDFVLASAENALNWIQSHKALYNAHRIIKKTGKIILIAPCSDGLGDDRFRYWIRKNSIQAIYKDIRRSIEVLGQTALSTKTMAPKTILITSMSKEDINDIGIETALDIDSAIRKVINYFNNQGIQKPSYYIMPHAKTIVPFVL